MYHLYNTSLIYELSALKDIAKPLLEEITQDEKEYAEAQRLLNILKYFESIPNEEVPTNSLLKEFLGGGNFKYQIDNIHKKMYNVYSLKIKEKES